MMLLVLMLNLALLCGTLAGGYWYLRGQSMRKGFGFTVHWWSLGDLAAGALISLLAMAGIFVIEWLIGGIQVQGFQFNPEMVLADVRGQAFIALFEETTSRSLQLSGFQIGLGLFLALLLTGAQGGTFTGRMDAVLDWCKWGAILISAGLFGYAHITNPGASYFTAFGNALGGLMYGIAFLGGRNIWLPIGMHFGWNFFQGALFGFPVSGKLSAGLIMQQPAGMDLLTGGVYGPEGGLIGMSFRFVVIALTLYYLYLRAGKRGEIKTLTFPIKVYENPPRDASVGSYTEEVGVA